MNAMTQALLSAGVRLPTARERLWRAIKEQPGVTIAQIAKRYPDMPRGTISGQLHMLVELGQVYNRPRPGSKHEVQWFTDEEAYEHKQPQPRSRKGTPNTGTSPRTVATSPAPEVRPVGNGKTELDADIDRFIDNLTIRQARALMDKLKRVFA